MEKNVAKLSELTKKRSDFIKLQKDINNRCFDGGTLHIELDKGIYSPVSEDVVVRFDRPLMEDYLKYEISKLSGKINEIVMELGDMIGVMKSGEGID